MVISTSNSLNIITAATAYHKSQYCYMPEPSKNIEDVHTTLNPKHSYTKGKRENTNLSLKYE
jgi:hypothetical protein